MSARFVSLTRFVAPIVTASVAVVSLGGIGCGRFDEPAPQTGGRQAPTVQVGPQVSEYSIWRPFFATTLGNHTPSEIVGTGFAVATDEDAPPRLVTSLRLIGPETGLAEAENPAAARASVTEVWLTDAFGATDNTLRAGDPVEFAMPQEPTSSGESAAEVGSTAEEKNPDELVARELIVVTGGPAEKRLRPLFLSGQPASKGDTVWLVTAVFGGASPSQKCHEATVMSVGEEGYFEYEFANERLSLHATSGAPLLNDDGQVVGVHLTGARDENGSGKGDGDAEAEAPAEDDTTNANGPVTGRGIASAPLKSLLSGNDTGQNDTGQNDTGQNDTGQNDTGQNNTGSGD